MQDRRNAGQEGCRIGGMKDRSDAGREGYRKGRMQDRRDAGQKLCRTGVMQDRSYARQEECRTGGMQNRRVPGQLECSGQDHSWMGRMCARQVRCIFAGPERGRTRGKKDKREEDTCKRGRQELD